MNEPTNIVTDTEPKLGPIPTPRIEAEPPLGAAFEARGYPREGRGHTPKSQERYVPKLGMARDRRKTS